MSSKYGDYVAGEMAKILGDNNFQNIFKKASVSESEVTNLVNDGVTDNTDILQEKLAAVNEYEAFERFAKKNDKKEEKEEEKKEKKEDKKKDNKKDKKDKKDKSSKKEKKAAVRYVVENFIRTSEALENMGFVRSATEVLTAVDTLLKEANAELTEEDDNDVRGMDLLLGLDDPEAMSDLGDKELDDPASSAALEDILKENPELVDQLRDRIKAKLQEGVGSEDENIETELSDLYERKIPKAPPIGVPGEVTGEKTIPVSEEEYLSVDDKEVVNAFQELNEWVKNK